MDIHNEWNRLMGANAGAIMAFTTELVREYWRICDEPWDRTALDAYRKKAMSGDYKNLISESAEFILEQTGIQVDNSYLLR